MQRIERGCWQRRESPRGERLMVSLGETLQKLGSASVKLVQNLTRNNKNTLFEVRMAEGRAKGMTCQEASDPRRPRPGSERRSRTWA